MLKLIAITSALLLSACLDSSTPSEPESGDDDVTEVGRQLPDRKDGPADDRDDRDICALLPADGACAYACDEDMMMDFIPEGACALIPCTLTDGTKFNAGGCNLWIVLVLVPNARRCTSSRRDRTHRGRTQRSGFRSSRRRDAERARIRSERG